MAFTPPRPALALAALLAISIMGGMVGRCSGQQNYTSIMDLINNRTDLTTVKAAVARANLTSFLTTATNTTALLPTDSAFTAFLASVNMTASDLLALSPNIVANLLKYHITKNGGIGVVMQLGALGLLAGDNASIATELTTGNEPWSRLTVAYNGSGTTPASLTILATSSRAKLLEMDITAGPNNEVSIIDSVLTYWYPSVQQALSSHVDLTDFVTGLKTNAPSLWNQLSNQTNITVFAPMNYAVASAKSKYDVDLAVVSKGATSIVNCHVTKGMADLPSPAEANAALAPQRESVSSQDYCTITTNRNSSGVYFTSVGNSANYVGIDFMPVGYPWKPQARIHAVDGVALNTFSSVDQYLNTYSPTNSLSGLWASWINTEDSLRARLADPKLAVAVLVPTSTGINALAASKGTTAANWLSQLNANGKKRTLFDNHMVNPTLAPAELKSGSRTLNTYVGTARITTQAANVTVAGVTSTAVQLTAQQSTALLAPSAPGFEPSVEVMFGRSYIYIITSPMVPSEVPLPTSGSGGGGAAAITSPCAWLVMLLAGLAAVMVAAGRH